MNLIFNIQYLHISRPTGQIGSASGPVLVHTLRNFPQIYLSEATTTALIGCLLLLQVYKRHLTGRKLHRSALRFLILTVLYQVACGLFGQNVYVQQRSTWSEARQYCRQHHTDLTSVDTTEEIIALLLEAQKKDLVLPNMWIGLYKDVNHTWKWSGGTNISHQFCSNNWRKRVEKCQQNGCGHSSIAVPCNIFYFQLSKCSKCVIK
uniref:C-type lectin domain-containing protein n=1 Tax=Amphiprion ocellaris TaxID=80972 RepID=A0AAQ5YR12_AMPOC